MMLQVPLRPIDQTSNWFNAGFYYSQTFSSFSSTPATTHPAWGGWEDAGWGAKAGWNQNGWKA